MGMVCRSWQYPIQSATRKSSYLVVNGVFARCKGKKEVSGYFCNTNNKSLPWKQGRLFCFSISSPLDGRDMLVEWGGKITRSNPPHGSQATSSSMEYLLAVWESRKLPGYFRNTNNKSLPWKQGRLFCFSSRLRSMGGICSMV